jgi:hypothetical protein
MSRRSPRTGLTRSTEIKRAAETYERNPTRDNLAQLEQAVWRAWSALDGEPPKQAPEGVPPHMPKMRKAIPGVIEASLDNAAAQLAYHNAVSHKPE